MTLKREFWIVAFIATGTIAVLEIAARIYFHVQEAKEVASYNAHYPPNTGIHEFARVVNFRFISLYAVDAARASGPEFAFDEYGFRLDKHKVRLGEKADYKTIWMFGGSTTMGLGLRANETIASNLNDLMVQSGKKWRVINMGIGGASSTQELLLLTELLHWGYRPDAIVVYDGINEIPALADSRDAGFSGWQKRGYKPAMITSIELGKPSLALMSFTLKTSSALYRAMSVAKQALRKRARGNARVPATSGRLTWEGTDWNDLMNRYLVNLNMMKGAADFLKVPAFFFFQPVMEYEEHYGWRKLSSDEIQRLSGEIRDNEHVRRDMVMSSRFASLRDALAPRWWDISNVFADATLGGETLYADPRHPNGRGTKIIASRIFRELSALPDR